MKMNDLVIVPTNAVTASISQNMYQRYLDYVDVRASSASTYRRCLKQLFEYFQLNGIHNPERKDLMNFRQYLADVKGLKPTTIQSYITTAKLFFKWTAQEGLYPNISDNLKGIKLNAMPKKSYLTPDQIKEVLNTSKGESEQELRDFAIIVLMASCGLRTIEVSRADVSDIRVVGSKVRLFVQGKGKSDKTAVNVPNEVLKHINRYLKVRDAKDSEPLFTSVAYNCKGERMTTRSISKICKEHMKQAGIDTPFHTAHSLRHTAVTLALLVGQDITEVQQFARHAKIDTTMIYNHALNEEKNGCSDAVADAIFA